MHVGIAGAGLIGRLIAWQLLRGGHQVTLFDRDPVNGESSAARVAAAMLAPFSEVVNCEVDIFNWGLEGLAQWPQLLQQLYSDGAATVAFQQQGSIVVAHPQDQAHLDHFNQLLRSRAQSHLDAVSFLRGDELHQLEPHLSDQFQQGTFLQAEGCIDNWGLLDQLAKVIVKLGGDCRWETPLTQISPFEIHTATSKQCFDQVIDCRGFGAKKDLQSLRGVRGEVLWVKAPDVSIERPIRLMHPRYQLYIAPKPNHHYVIGATEIESESLAPITIRSSLELQSALYSINSSFGEATVIKAYANCRPAFLDNLPRVEHSDGLIRVNGLYRHGYLLSPVVLDAALQAIAGNFNHSIHHPITTTLMSVQAS
jgi:glycine oxidase